MPGSNLKFLDGSSVLAQMIRSKDWSQHSLGSPDSWAADLKTTVSLMLNSSFPMFVAWGKERKFLYNDGYAEILGKKHPHALGRAFQEIWSEIWQDLIPLIDKVDRGESVYLEDLKLLVNRYDITEEAYFTFSYSPIWNSNGEGSGLFCVVIETTKRKQAEEALQHSEQRLKLALKSGGLGSWQMDLKTQTLTRSPECQRIIGLDENNMNVFQDLNRYVHPDDRDDVSLAWTEAVRTKNPFGHVYRIIRSNGEVRWIDARGEVMPDQEGLPRYFIGTVSDITERKELQLTAERERTRLYSSLMDAPVVIGVLRGEDLIMEFANKLYLNVIGATEDIKGKALTEAIPSMTPEVVATIRKVLLTGEPYRSGEFSILLDYDRTGSPYNKIWNLIYQPLRGASGEVEAVMTCCFEVTEQVEARKRLEEFQRELANERDKLNLVFRESPAAMALWQGSEMIFEMVNPRYQTLFPDRELVGKPFLEALPEFEGQPFIDFFRKVLETGEPFVGHEVLAQHRRTPNGPIEDRYYDFTYVQIKDIEGKPYGVYDHAIDVTDRVLAKRALVESEERFRQIANALPIIIWTARPDGEVDWYNDWWYEYLGQPRGTTWDDPNVQPMHPEDVARTNEIWPRTLAAGEAFNMEQRFRRGSDGQYRWHLVRGVPIHDESGKITKYVGGNTDIHDEKMLAEEFKKARAAAESASLSKSNFLANMSHEIRTPLTAILGFSSLLKDPTLDANERDEFIDTIVRNGNSLTRIIDDILDLAKVEAGRLEIEEIPFSLYDLAADVVEIFKDKTREKNIDLLLNIDESVPPRIWSDPTRLRQILVNLIGNAVKFTDVGSVRVKARAIPDGDRIQVLIDVKDTGIGLTPEQQGRLFKPFMQADNSMTRKFGGTGLGLALSQRLSQALSGEVSITDCKPGGGCTFTLSFMAKLANDAGHTRQQNQGESKPAVKPLEGLRILVVEDSTDNQILIARLLTRNGANVDTAMDGHEGFDKAISGSYDLVLMDIQMPRMDGYQAKQALDKSGYRNPVIALTAHAISDERVKTSAAGFAGHLTKPLIAEELLKTVALAAFPGLHRSP